jgi:plastocyanin
MNGTRPFARSCIAAPVAAGLALLALGCGGEDGDGGGGGGEQRTAKSAVNVNIASFKFAPDPIEVQAGGTVRWVNQDTAPHTAEAEARPAFDTGRLNTGDTKRVRFDRPGRFTYFCDFHRFMTGTVEVVK